MEERRGGIRRKGEERRDVERWNNEGKWEIAEGRKGGTEGVGGHFHEDKVEEDVT